MCNEGGILKILSINLVVCLIYRPPDCKHYEFTPRAVCTTRRQGMLKSFLGQVFLKCLLKSAFHNGLVKEYLRKEHLWKDLLGTGAFHNT